MRLMDLYPLRGTFAPGATVTLAAGVESHVAASAWLRLSIYHLDHLAADLDLRLDLVPGRQTIGVEWPAPKAAPRGYGVEAELRDESGRVRDSAATAFDVLPHWTAFPRYGFLADFRPGRADVESAMEWLARFHVNGLQFYDWQYRHDRLLAAEDEYLDPLGRRLSLDTLRRCIDAAHARGMACLPYLAVYAASAEFWRAHPDWALYDSVGHPIPFGEDFLGLMNPAPGGPWTEHLLAECARTLDALPFDGLHIDQYGEPKVAFDSPGAPVDLPAAFAGFIARAKAEHPSATVAFNAVGNWPIEALAASPQDFAYIEIWPPTPTYRELVETVANARRLSNGKPVVIALYLPADRPANVRLADALIFSAGGSRIEHGEAGRLLTDPYFPKSQPLSADLASVLRRYHDFAVRYGDLLGPGALDEGEGRVVAPQGVRASVRHSPGRMAIGLVNLAGLGPDPRWDEPHAEPQPMADVPLRVTLPTDPARVLWASPDRGPMRLELLPWDRDGAAVRLTLPHLGFWALVVFDLPPSEPSFHV